MTSVCLSPNMSSSATISRSLQMVNRVVLEGSDVVILVAGGDHRHRALDCQCVCGETVT